MREGKGVAAMAWDDGEKGRKEGGREGMLAGFI